jgi:hypothetical protein
MNQFLILEFLYKGPLSKLSFFMGINGKKAPFNGWNFQTIYGFVVYYVGIYF